MSFLFCEKCWGYYELEEGEYAEDFESCQCGGELTEIDSLREIFKDTDSKVAIADVSTKSDIKNLEINKM